MVRGRRQRRSPALFPIASLLPALPRLKIVDVGAMNLGAGTVSYEALAKAVPCDVIAFEPVRAEFDKLVRDRKEGERFLPYFVGDASKATFHECNFPMTSSLYEPNQARVHPARELPVLRPRGGRPRSI